MRIKPYSNLEIATMDEANVKYLLAVWSMKPRRLPEEDAIITKLNKRWKEIQVEKIIFGAKYD